MLAQLRGSYLASMIPLLHNHQLRPRPMLPSRGPAVGRCPGQFCSSSIEFRMDMDLDMGLDMDLDMGLDMDLVWYIYIIYVIGQREYNREQGR